MAWQARQGSARPGTAWRVGASLGRLGLSRLGSVRLGWARRGQAGAARHRMVRFVGARLGMAGSAWHGRARCGMARRVAAGVAEPSRAHRACRGALGQGTVRHGEAGRARLGRARLGAARSGMTAENDVWDELREFNDQRASGVMSTDTPKILGFSRWGTALTVYEDKLGISPPRAASLPAWLGLKLQATVGELYTAATGTRLRAVGETRLFRHPEYHWLGCHLDFRAWGNTDLLVEGKTRDFVKRRSYGEDGSTEVPLEEWAQCQHQMMVTGARMTHLAVLFGHREFCVYPIERNEDFITELIPQLDRFWHEQVVPQIPPPPTGHPADDAALRRRHPEDDGVIIPATSEQEAVIRSYAEARRVTDAAAYRMDELANRIKEFIGEAAGIDSSLGTITFKKSRDGVHIDWEAIAGTYHNVIEELLLLANPGDDPEAVARLANAQVTAAAAQGLFTTPTSGSRRFTVKLRED